MPDTDTKPCTRHWVLLWLKGHVLYLKSRREPLIFLRGSFNKVCVCACAHTYTISSKVLKKCNISGPLLCKAVRRNIDMDGAFSFAFIKLSIKREGRVPHLSPRSSPPASYSHGSQEATVGNEDPVWWVVERIGKVILTQHQIRGWRKQCLPLWLPILCWWTSQSRMFRSIFLSVKNWPIVFKNAGESPVRGFHALRFEVLMYLV